MSHQSCGGCGREVEKAHRVHAGVRYCQRCYCREFKRRLCEGCGTYKRMLRSEPQPRCQACIAAQPCVRCKRVGQPVGLMTPSGPACNSCRTYFTKERPCQQCGTLSRRLSRTAFEQGEKEVCPRCASAHHRTCSICRRHRPGEADADGRWRCGRCAESAVTQCQTCARPMPSGRGKRCDACYWRDRAASNARQLVELMTRPRVREAFLAFAAWLVQEESAMPRRVRRLPEHAKFFAELDRLADAEWTAEFLLQHFVPATLRRHELPVKWLGLQGNSLPSKEDKQRQADLRRVNEAIMQLPPNSVARKVVDGFAGNLLKRLADGEMSVRSVRLALRPAISLLQTEDRAGGRLPQQAALERYLDNVPGQRAAMSTFLCFLKTTHGVVLKLPPKRSTASAATRKTLERQIAALVLASKSGSVVDKRWVPMALRYFHRLSAAQAKAIHAGAVTIETTTGLELRFEGNIYWLPKTPELAPTG